MSLKITNKLTEKQRSLLKKLGYDGDYNLTVEQAGKQIDKLVIDKGLRYHDIDEIAHDYYNFPD